MRRYKQISSRIRLHNSQITYSNSVSCFATSKNSMVAKESPRMPPDTNQRPRQEPVSCESCRKKKLKCNREQPCSNCSARSVTCDFQGRRIPTQSAASRSPGVEEVPVLRAENAAIKARIDRLEDIIFSSSSYFDADGRSVKARRLGDREKSTTALPSPSTTLSTASESESARNYRGEVQWLEDVGKYTSIPFCSHSAGSCTPPLHVFRSISLLPII